VIRLSAWTLSKKATTRHYCAPSPSLARIVAVTKGLPAFDVRCSGARKIVPVTREKAVSASARVEGLRYGLGCYAIVTFRAV
jgi:hypothetical protein